LWLSYFEIYGGKLFDLLSERRLVAFCNPYVEYLAQENLLVNSCFH
jgi:hypothetical protein